MCFYFWYIIAFFPMTEMHPHFYALSVFLKDVKFYEDESTEVPVMFYGAADKTITGSSVRMQRTARNASKQS